MAVIEPRRKSPNSKNSVKMAERCCSRLARDSGKGYLLILTYHYVRICDTKKKRNQPNPSIHVAHPSHHGEGRSCDLGLTAHRSVLRDRGGDRCFLLQRKPLRGHFNVPAGIGERLALQALSQRFFSVRFDEMENGAGDEPAPVALGSNPVKNRQRFVRQGDVNAFAHGSTIWPTLGVYTPWMCRSIQSARPLVSHPVAGSWRGGRGGAMRNRIAPGRRVCPPLRCV